MCLNEHLKNLQNIMNLLNVEKKTKVKLEIIGIYQAMGGLIGFYPIAVNFFSQGLSRYFNIIFLPFTLLYTFSLVCGYLLLTGNFKKGINLSIYNQALQILSFSVLGFGYMYAAGIFAAIKLDLTQDIFLGLDFDVSHFILKLNSDFDVTYISINVVPVFILGVLFRFKELFEKKPIATDFL